MHWSDGDCDNDDDDDIPMSFQISRLSFLSCSVINSHH